MTQSVAFSGILRCSTVAIALCMALAWPVYSAQASSVPTEQELARRCAGLKGSTLLGSAKIVATTIGPESGRGVQTSVSYCRVDGQALDSALQFRVELPLSGWNRRFLELGGGGFKGSIGNLFSYGGVTLSPRFDDSKIVTRLRGYAIAKSNGGHDGRFDSANAEFALDPIKLTEYTYLAEHRTAIFTKALVEQFYGAAPEKSYFFGASMGGHDALMEAQRYPLDFDGIVAVAPLGNAIGGLLQFHRISNQLRKPGAVLNPAKQDLLAKAVLAQCDALDGLADGIISKPDSCHFNPETLRCAGGKDTGNTCLSDIQIETLKVITSEYATADGKWMHPGYPWGGENDPNGWGQWIWPLPMAPNASGQAMRPSLQTTYAEKWIRGFITRNLAYEAAKFDPNQHLGEIDALGALWNAFHPDLSSFLHHGGRLIVANGTIDSAVSYRDTVRYHNLVVKEMGQANADKVMELFLAFGEGHSYAGPGPSDVDWLKAITTWVEQGIPPSKQYLIFDKVEEDGSVSESRPVCKYPSYPRYNGNGDPKQAASYTCSTK